jgi:hypothetical protein
MAMNRAIFLNRGILFIQLYYAYVDVNYLSVELLLLIEYYNHIMYVLTELYRYVCYKNIIVMVKIYIHEHQYT